MSDSFNPYSPPKAPITEESLEARLPRPRAIKWATFILGMFTFIAIINYWRAIAKVGAVAVWQAEPLFNPVLLLPFGFGLSLFGRSRMAYYGLVCILGFLSFQVFRVFMGQWLAPTALFWMDFGERAGEFMASFSLWDLFYRVAFGLPSRRYYGLVKAPVP